jgi:hypothetical protein
VSWAKRSIAAAIAAASSSEIEPAIRVVVVWETLTGTL